MAYDILKHLYDGIEETDAYNEAYRRKEKEIKDGSLVVGIFKSDDGNFSYWNRNLLPEECFELVIILEIMKNDLVEQYKKQAFDVTRNKESMFK